MGSVSIPGRDHGGPAPEDYKPVAPCGKVRVADPIVSKAMSILSIQSAVAYGHVGNSAAVFPLQRLGFEVWPVNTVAFSNHPGYGDWRGRVVAAAEVSALIAGIGRLGAFAGCQAVLSGYLGSVENGRVVLETAAAVRRANPDALYLCAPVIGDRAEGLYVAADLARFFQEEAVGQADIAVANAFELEYLTGRPVRTAADALVAARALLARGPRIAVVSSLGSAGGPADDAIETLAVSRAEAWRVATPRLPTAAKGAGDVLAALFLGHFLRTGRVREALANAVSAIFAVLAATAAAAAPELKLVAAQDDLAQPRRRFAAEALA